MDSNFPMPLQVENLYKCLEREYKRNGEQPLSLFELAFNPHSFAQTIENLFHLSFLVKDGRAGLVSGEGALGGGDGSGDGIMRVAWLPLNEKGAQHNQTQAEEEQRSALAFTLDMGIWRGICKRYHLRKCLVPDRGYHESDNENEEHCTPEDAADDQDQEMGEEQEEEEEDDQDEEEQVERNAAELSQVNASQRVKPEPISQ